MTRSSTTRIFTPFADPERQFRRKKSVTPIPIQNIYSFYDSDISEPEIENDSEQNLDNITIEQYLSLQRNDSDVGVRRPNFNQGIEIKGQLLNELREITFHGLAGENALIHQNKFLELLCLYNITDDKIIPWIFARTLKGFAKKWLEKISSDSVNTWENLSKSFIKIFCPPSEIFKKINEIHSFQQSKGSTLYQAWEEFSELLLQCPFHDLNDFQQINIFYKGLDFTNRQKLDGQSLIFGLTPSEARKVINTKIMHSQRWEKHEELKGISTVEPDKFDNLTKQFNQFIKESQEKQKILDDFITSFINSTKKNLQNQEMTIRKLEQQIYKLTEALNEQKAKEVQKKKQQQEKIEPFSEKVKRRILEEQTNNTTNVEKVLMIKLNARCSAMLTSNIPPKEKDPGSFKLPCVIGNTIINNALADLGASISVMPYSMFKRLNLGAPKPVNMIIEMADRSIKTPIGVIENVLVNIHDFTFPVDFIILDITEDNRVPIILGRPMLATAHAQIDVFQGKISLELDNKLVTFNTCEDYEAQFVAPVCVIFDEVGGAELIDEMLEDNDLGNYLSSGNSTIEPNADEIDPYDLIDFDEIETINALWVKTNDKTDLPKTIFSHIGNRIHKQQPYNLQICCKIGFVNFNPYIDLVTPFNVMTRKAYNKVMENELSYSGNNIVGIVSNIQVFIGKHMFLADFMILEDITEFVERGLTEVVIGTKLKNQIGLKEDITQGIVWLEIDKDKTIFRMPRAVGKLKNYSISEQNSLSPTLKLSREDKKKGIQHPNQKIKEFYKKCLHLGNEYKQYPDVIKWIQNNKV